MLRMNDTEQELYNLRWAATETMSDVERARVEFTTAAIPKGCGTILDVGCGDGRLTRELHRGGYRVTGVDFSEVALSKLPVPGIRASADAIPVEDLSYDLVLSTEMLEHLNQGVYQRTILEFSRIARRYILITVPNRELLAEHISVCACGCKFHMWGHRRSYGSRSLEALFPRFGLDQVKEFGPTVFPYSRILLLFKQRLGRSWAWDAATRCPNCGAANAPASGFPIIAKLCDYTNANWHTLPWLTIHRAWLLAVYTRRGTTTETS
jgi:SAM-dependent methyltransferase